MKLTINMFKFVQRDYKKYNHSIVTTTYSPAKHIYSQGMNYLSIDNQSANYIDTYFKQKINTHIYK